MLVYFFLLLVLLGMWSILVARACITVLVLKRVKGTPLRSNNTAVVCTCGTSYTVVSVVAEKRLHILFAMDTVGSLSALVWRAER